MTVSYRSQIAKQYTEIDGDLNTLLEMFYGGDQKFKDIYNMKVIDVTLSTSFLPKRGSKDESLLLTYLIKYEATQDLSGAIGKVGQFGSY